MDKAEIPARGPLAPPSPLVETLSDVAYRRLWLAGLCANTTRWMDVLLLGWVALALTGSPIMVGVAAFCRALPMMVLGPVAGLVADRVSRARILAATQATSAAATALLAALFAAGVAGFGVLLALEMVVGVAWAVDFTTRRTAIYTLAGPARVASAVSLETVSLQLAKMAGPLAGGLILERSGPAGCYLALALLHAGALSGVLTLRRRLARPGVGASGPVFASLRDGLREARTRPLVRGVLLTTALMNLLVFPYQQMLPVFARDVYQVGPQLLGLLLAADGLGALVGALAVAVRRGSIPHALVFGGGAVAAAALLLAFAVVPAYGAAVVLLLALGIAESCFATMQGTIITLDAPPAARGRIMGILSACMGTQPVGALALGVFVSAAGAPLAVAVAAAVALAVMLPVAARMTIAAPAVSGVRRGVGPA